MNHYRDPFNNSHKLHELLHRRNKARPMLAVPLVLLALIMLTAAGCGERGVKLSSAQSKAFDNAPAEAQQAWAKALAADKANDYVNAQTLLDSLKQRSLSEPQQQALDTERAAFGQRLWQAAEKNDPAAVKAVQEINKAKSKR
jgi:hypothetical protein